MNNKEKKNEALYGKNATPYIKSVLRTEQKKKAVGKTLDKARGGMIGDLKRTMRDKDLKKDHYQAFKNQHNIK
jgi:hypothetical protein